MKTLTEYITSLNREAFIKIVSTVEEKLYGFGELTQIKDNLFFVTNRIGKKKLVSIVVSKLAEMAIPKEIESAVKYISDPSFSDKLDCYSVHPIDEKNKPLLIYNALDQYCIDLNIIDSSVLASYKDDCLFDIFPKEYTSKETIGNTQGYLYDILSTGHESTDIKINLISSVIIVSIFEQDNRVNLDDLQRITEKKLGRAIPNFSQILQKLGGYHKVMYDRTDRSIVHLSDSELASVKNIIEESRRLEEQFVYSFNEILESHSIDNHDECFRKLLSLYQSHFEFDASNDYEERSVSAFKDFRTFINDITDNPDITETVIERIRLLCDRNSYLNRISASNSFISLFKSDALEKYIKQKQNCIFLDTPPLVYLICYKSLYLTGDAMWHNPQFKSTRSLFDLTKKRDCGNVYLYTMKDYVNEVFGELQKAFQISWAERIAPVELLLRANNTFYNFYCHVKSKADYINMSVESFETFASSILCVAPNPFDSTDFEVSAKNAIRSLIERNYGIGVMSYIGRRYNLEDELKFYESTLTRNKSRSASENDTRTLLYLAGIENLDGIDNSKERNLYLATWDRSFAEFQAHLSSQGMRNEFVVASPAKIVNAISMAFFNIDVSCITNDIFLYADKKFSITANVKAFVNKITSLLGRMGTCNNSFFKAVFDWYNEQVIKAHDEYENLDQTDNRVEQFLLSLVDSIEKQLDSEEKEILVKDVEVSSKMTQIIEGIKDQFSDKSDSDTTVNSLISQLKEMIKRRKSNKPKDRVFFGE